MTPPSGTPTILGEAVVRAFADLLKVPLVIIAGFILLAVGTWLLDHSEASVAEPGPRLSVRSLFPRRPGHRRAARHHRRQHHHRHLHHLLAASARHPTGSGGVEPLVHDQFLRRRFNQLYFGFFVGLALFTLVTLATVDPPYNQVLGASVAPVLMDVALTLIILLLYTTIKRMRPSVVIESIHDHILLARERQQAWLPRNPAAAAQERRGGTGSCPISRISGLWHPSARPHRLDVDLDRKIEPVAGPAGGPQSSGHTGAVGPGAGRGTGDDRALAALIASLDGAGRRQAAQQVQSARDRLAAPIGKLEQDGAVRVGEPV